MPSEFDRLYDQVRSHLMAELLELCEVWKRLPAIDHAAMIQVIKNLASCTVAEQLGLGYSRLELDAATAALANFKAGLELIARRNLLAAAKRVGGWLLGEALKLGANWLTSWADAQLDRL
jgi:hypothetical protein